MRSGHVSAGPPNSGNLVQSSEKAHYLQRLTSWPSPAFTPTVCPYWICSLPALVGRYRGPALLIPAY